MFKNKKALVILLSLVLTLSSVTAFASTEFEKIGKKTYDLEWLYSKSVNGVITECQNPSMIGENVGDIISIEQGDVQTRGSFIVYGNYIPNTTKGTFNRRDANTSVREFWYHSAEVKTGTVYTYVFDRSISETYSKTHTFDAGARAQGGVAFITELEGHVNYQYASSKTITKSINESSGVEVDAKTYPSNAGYWEFTWWPVYNYYNITTNWEYYTIDDPNTLKVGPRWVGSVSEPTSYLHLASNKRY